MLSHIAFTSRRFLSLSACLAKKYKSDYFLFQKIIASPIVATISNQVALTPLWLISLTVSLFLLSS